MNELSGDDDSEVTPKGDAFIHYYFQARGGEKDLSMDQAMLDFEHYIYVPTARHALIEFITEVAEAAVSVATGGNLDSEDPEEAKEAFYLAGVTLFRLYSEHVLGMEGDDPR